MRAFVLFMVILVFIAFSSAGVLDTRKDNAREALILENDSAWDVNLSQPKDLTDSVTFKKLTSENIEPTVIRTRRGLKRRFKRIHKKAKAAYHKVLGRDGVGFVNAGIKAAAVAAGASAGALVVAGLAGK